MLIPWEVLRSEITYEDRWIRIRSDSCRTGSGELAEPYHVLEYGAWVNVVGLTSEREIVLVRQYRHGIGRIVTELPSGNVESGEDSAAAARRELREETGFEATEVIPIGSTYANAANQDNIVASFLALDVAEAGSPSLDGGEEIEVVRRDFVDYVSAVLEGEEILQGLHLAALHFAVHHLSSGGRAIGTSVRERLAAQLFGGSA